MHRARRRMARRTRLSTSIALAALMGALDHGQALRGQTPADSAGSAQFATITQAVVLDVVVRDRRQQPVTGLSRADFEVREDGVLQPIAAFQAIASGARSSADPTPSGHGDADSSGGVPAAPVVLAVVFENLGPEGRARAQQAALTLVQGMSARQEMVGVYVVRRGLETVLPFSSVEPDVRVAIDGAARRPGCPVLETGGTGAHVRGGTLTDCAGMDDHRSRGVATLDGLTLLARQLGQFEGRKAMAVFSEGLDFTTGCRGQFCDDRQERLRDLILEAARNRIAVYTFDAAGLRLHPTATGQLMAEPRAALTILARETGGVFAGDTNDLGEAVARMQADLANYYMLGYTSTWPPGPEQPRTVRVRVRQKGASVLVRQAVPPALRSGR
jgi:VWFA-related protein